MKLTFASSLLYACVILLCRGQYHAARIVLPCSVPLHQIILHLLILVIVYVKVVQDHSGAAQRQLKTQPGILVEAHIRISYVGARGKIRVVQLLDPVTAAV